MLTFVIQGVVVDPSRVLRKFLSMFSGVVQVVRHHEIVKWTISHGFT